MPPYVQYLRFIAKCVVAENTLRGLFRRYTKSMSVTDYALDNAIQLCTIEAISTTGQVA